MKTITFFTTIVILFLTNQIFSQVNNKLELKPDNLLQERIIPHSILDEKAWQTSESDIFQDSKSRILVKKTILDNGFFLEVEEWQSWDGYSWIEDYMYTHTYDDNFNMIGTLAQDWDGSDWVNDWKDTFIYDSNNNEIERFGYLWDGYNWVNDTKYAFTYDVNNNMIEELRETWNGSTWENNEYVTYTYDGNNNMIEELVQGWDGSNWMNDYKDTYNYDGNDNEIEMLHQEWDGSNWANIQKRTRTYDGNHNIIESLYQNWDGYNWVNAFKFTQTFDVNNNRIELLRQNWDGSNWVNAFKNTYIYVGNNLTEVYWRNWDGSNWVNNRYFTHSYDGPDNNLSVSLWQYWDGYTYVNDVKQVFIYIIIPVELTSFTATSQTGKVYLNWTTVTELNNLGFEVERKIINNNKEGEWVRIGFSEGYGTTTELKEYSYIDDISTITATSLSYRLKQIDYDGSYEYSEEVLVDNPAPVDFALQQNFPNPYNPATTITYNLPIKSKIDLVVYNTLGEILIQLVNAEKEAGQHSVEFNAIGLPSGIYFYKLQAGDFIETKKMVLLR